MDEVLTKILEVEQQGDDQLKKAARELQVIKRRYIVEAFEEAKRKREQLIKEARRRAKEIVQKAREEARRIQEEGLKQVEVEVQQLRKRFEEIRDEAIMLIVKELLSI